MIMHLSGDWWAFENITEKSQAQSLFTSIMFIRWSDDNNK